MLGMRSLRTPLAVGMELRSIFMLQAKLKNAFRLKTVWIIHGDRGGGGAVKTFIFSFLPLAVLCTKLIGCTGVRRGAWLCFRNTNTLWRVGEWMNAKLRLHNADRKLSTLRYVTFCLVIRSLAVMFSSNCRTTLMKRGKKSRVCSEPRDRSRLLNIKSEHAGTEITKLPINI